MIIITSILVGVVLSNKKGEERIIGGKAVEGIDRPPFMAVFNFKPSSTVKCTASIVSPHWLISAAHCLVAKEHFTTKPCLSQIPDIRFKTLCTTNTKGDILITFPEQEEETPQVFINVDDMMDFQSETVKKFSVEKIVLHANAYKGGKYGEYGGYDFIMIKVSGKMDASLAACLPGANFVPSYPMIGGYGRYRRVPCETTDKGPQIYEYCKVDPGCTKGTKSFREAKCPVKFTFNGKSYNHCITNQPTPTQLDEDCMDFRQKMNVTDKKMQSNNINEIVLLSESSEVLTSCYRTSPGKHGWCGTTQNIVTGEVSAPNNQDTTVKESSGWGMCGDTCHDEERGHLTGKARVKPVEIMDQVWCDDRLAALRRGLEKPNQERGFWVFPRVYCVAYNETYQTIFYQKKTEGYAPVSVTKELMKELGREDSFYIRATGSCKGDSGGPLYERKKGKYVVFGTTSRGTGPLGNCGGRGNPTHYVRVQYHMDFLKKYVDDDLCIMDK